MLLLKEPLLPDFVCPQHQELILCISAHCPHSGRGGDERGQKEAALPSCALFPL